MNGRYGSIDLLRGFIIVNMVIYHLLWDMVYLFEFKADWFVGDFGFFWERFICLGFIIISGFCFRLGKRRLKRAGVVFALGVLVSLFTALFMYERRIVFGILTFLGVSMALFVPLDTNLSNVKPLPGMLLCLLLYILLGDISKFGGYNMFTAFLGFPYEGFYSSDYFPLIPWIFMFGFGYYLYAFIKKADLLKYLNTFRFKPLEFLGRRSLLIYIIHQPVIYGVLLVVYKYFV